MRVRLIPGFGQPASMWTPVLDHLRRSGVEATAVEVPDALDFAATANRLADDADEPVLWAGYSLGGRLALRLALDRPDRTAGIVVVSATAGIEHPAERARRAADDRAEARSIDRDGVDEFLRRWLTQPLFAGLAPELARRAERAAAMTGERLMHQMEVLGQGRMEPMWDRLREVRAPFVAVAGLADEKYSALAGRLAASVPGGRSVLLPGGHALPLEAPAPVAATITSVSRS